MATKEIYKTDDVEERNVTVALREMFSSIAAMDGSSGDPLALVCRCLVHCVDDIQFAYYCYQDDEIGVISAVRDGVKVFLPPPDVQRKVASRLKRTTRGGEVAVIGANDALSVLSPVQRKRWKCHQSVAVKVVAEGSPSAVLSVFLKPDFVVTDRHRAWMMLFRDAASALLTRCAALVRAQVERDEAVKTRQDKTLEVESFRERVRQHLLELENTRADFRSGNVSLGDAFRTVEQSAKKLYALSDVTRTTESGQDVEFNDKALDRWVTEGLGDSRIKALFGVRGSNKSAILDAIRSRVLASGVDESHVVFIDFEDARFRRFKTAKDVGTYLNAFPKSKKPYYLFMDEVGMIGWYADLLWSLSARPGWNVWFATSSVLPVGVQKGGRRLPISLFRAWTDPRIPRSRNDLERIWYELFMRDVVCGIEHPDVRSKELLAEYYSDHLGEVSSLRDVVAALKAVGRPLSRSTVSVYRQALIDACLIEISEIYDVFAEEVVSSVGGRTFYTDLELRAWRYGPAPEHDETRIALNRLYLELRQKYDKVYTPKDKDADFVTIEPNGKPCLWNLPPAYRPLPNGFRWGSQP